MAAAVFGGRLGRGLGGSRFLREKPLTVSLHTMLELEEPFRFERAGWEFSGNHCDSSHLNRLKASGLRLPERYISDAEISIKHLDTGIKFCFNAYDVLFKREQEKFTGNPLLSDLPSYASPLLAPNGHTYDCAYVGKVVIEKPDEEPQKIFPNWEDIDWKVLHEQIVWTMMNEIQCRTPYSFRFLDFGDLTTIMADKQFDDEKKSVGISLYHDHYEGGYSTCIFSLVVTNYGWFVYLQQCLTSSNGDVRTRQMTMHCDFKQNTIFREIMEDQTDEFESRLPKWKNSELKTGMLVFSLDHTPWPQFHEAKQFKIQGACMGKSRSCTVDDAPRYTSFTVGEWEEANHQLWDVHGRRIQSFYANGGELLQEMGKESMSRIQIIPLFHTPCIPQPLKWPLNGNICKSAYMLRAMRRIGLSACVVNFIDDYIRGNWSNK